MNRSGLLGNAGIALLELAILIGFLMALVLGIIHYGIGLRTAQTISDLSKNAARAGSDYVLSSSDKDCTKNGLGEFVSAWMNQELPKNHLDPTHFEVQLCVLEENVDTLTLPTTVQLIQVSLRRTSCEFCFEHIVPLLPEVQGDAVYSSTCINYVACKIL